MTTDNSYDEILQMTQRRAADNAKRIRLINFGLIASIAIMIGAVIIANGNYQALKKAKAELAIKKAEADSLRAAAQQAKALNEINNQRNLTRIKNDPKQAVAIIKIVESKTDSAKIYNDLGYRMLKKKEFAQAMQSFKASENFVNGYKDSYELAFLLRKNQDKFTNEEGQIYLLRKIFNEYNYLRILSEDDFK